MRTFKTITTLALFTITVLASMTTLGAVVVLDGISAIVDEDVIMKSEVANRMTSIKAQMAAQEGAKLPPDDVLEKQVVERLVVESLQMQMANRAGVRISDSELNQAMTRIAQQNRLSLPDFQRALQRDGISYGDMREQIRREMMIARVQQGIMRTRIEITDQEIDSFLESDMGANVTSDEYRIAHILIPLPSDASADEVRQTRDEADAVLAEIEAGGDFQSLAVEKSAGQNALEGGDLGWRKPVQLPTMFADIAQEMSVGEVRGPIKSGSGYHLIKLLQTRGASSQGQISQTHARHVLIKVSEIRTAEEARDLAESLRFEVIDGRPFEEVAKLYSDDPGSALSGGDLGWTREGEFVDNFANVLRRAPLNEVSQVFETEFGYHFLEVLGRRVEDFSSRFKRSQAENYLRSQMFEEELNTWLRELREDAFVEIRVDS